MTPAYAIHKLVRKDGTVEPRTVIELPEAEFKELESFGAVRTPTDAELSLFELTKPKAVPAEPTAAAPTKGKGGRKPKAADTVQAAAGDDTVAPAVEDTVAASGADDLLAD